MNIKNILIVSRAFYPFNSPRANRATELAKEFARQGHNVKVITSKEGDVETFCIQNNIEFKDLGNLTWPTPTIKGSGLILLFWRLIVRFSILLFEYPMLQLVFLVKKALKGENNHDLIISVAVPYPIHWGVALARKNNHSIAKTWVADCGDPYMGQENDTFTHPFYFGWVEKWFCRKTDFITVPTKNSYKGYYKKFHPKLKVIPQGFRFEDIEFYKGIKNNDKVIFGYGGVFIKDRRDPTEFINFLNELGETYNFEFHIYTKSSQIIMPLLNNTNRIQLKEILDRKSLLFEMSKMDFVVNFENVGIAQTPSKLIDYAIINKPILSVETGGLKTKVILEFLKKDYSNALVIDDKEQYRIENVTKKFLELVK
jgi:glycosyltransferase involved in cell wall biosynthesis